ncbi:probable LRR receptor-like serine/threonine-protein kinase At1g53430 [Herrania umbratica]|uniref:non-specific serine/threonine protein kinase n=1 Tax=Herrania umbratica TaxID=108875 RepID=A0A6J1B3U7_9ROSI|nr:probable LRR receptor-like serine/threonine-protein kinase At1g53430 [Herrania umbratica]
MESLRTIILAKNWLKESIPPKLGSSASIKTLDFAENLLTGTIPETLGNISSLEFLRLSDNQLKGPLPKSLGNLQNVYRMVVANNKLQGQLPQSFANLTSLRHFNVRGNEFIGQIPPYIGYWKQLQVLILQGNHFEGPLPGTFSSLENIMEMRIADLYGRNGEVFPFPNISRMRQLETLVLRNCSINASIPSYIGELQALNHLDLSYNKLSGEVPYFSEYGNLTNIFLRANKLTGSIPKWFANLTEANLDFSENNFTYSSSVVNYKSRNTNSFACCSSSPEFDSTWQKNNFFCDEDQPENDRLYINCGGDKVTAGRHTFERDAQPEGASTFYISDDKKWGYSSMGIYDPAQSRSMSYAHSIDKCPFQNNEASLYQTARVAPISLKYFGFCMKNGLYTVKLDFAEITIKEEAEHKSRGNRLFDVLIQGTKVLTDFNIKDVAGGLNENISQTFQAEVKENSLEIHLYWAGKGSKRGPFELYGPLVSAISVEPVLKPVKPSIKLSPLSIAGISGSIVLFLILIFAFLWKMGYLRGKESKIEAQKELISLPGGGLFTYRQLKVATQNFNNANKIGEGGFGAVFKGVLPNGTAIAVKQLSAKSKQGSREFVNEVGVISALQHPNLVKLLGCCIDENQLLLVYEYMENNSLAHALFGPEELRVQLNWTIRSKICRGIAKGLAFLHEESKLKIIHRDIKTTNILLDKDFTAKISDFGFAKLHEGEKTHVITKIAGTTGYMAPEYAMRGHLTSKADVYSFGVVLLEIVSGQNSASYRPNDESVYLLDLAYVLQEKGDLLALVDPILGSEYAAKEAKMILELAMLCTNPSPTLRPSMSEVVKVLKGKSRLNYTPSHAPYSADGFARAKAMASRSFSNYSRSMSREEPSNPASYEFSIKEEEVHISADYTPEVTDETGRSPLNNV